MRKVIVFNMMTLDGFFEGENHSIDWHNVDEEFNEFAEEQLKSTDLLLFGRRTYDLMAGYWPTPESIADDPVIASHMNTLPKMVFSRTLDHAPWNNTKLVKEVNADEIQKLKQQPGKDIFIFGSANLIATFRKLNLIDEYRIMIDPVILGTGTPMFHPLNGRLDLQLVATKVFRSGNVLLYYQPRK